METGETLRILREQRQISQKELAELLQVDHGRISRIETGKTKLDFDRLIEHLNGLKTEITDFVVLKNSDSDYITYKNSYIAAFDSSGDLYIKNAYRYFSKNKQISLENYFTYIKIKLFFHEQHPKIVPALTKKRT